VLTGLLRFVAKVLVREDWRIVRDRITFELRQITRREEFSPSLATQLLLVSGEDHRHRRHYGFDPYAICRAIWRRVIRQSREGASTIEQQIARVITNRFEVTIRRKVKEVLLAALIAESFPKALLPSVYLRIGYYGWRMNGYSQACLRLGFDPRNLSFEEAASLVARLKYPQPRVMPECRHHQIRRRSNHLLVLYQHHKLDDTYEHLLCQSIYISPVNPEFARSLPGC